MFKPRLGLPQLTNKLRKLSLLLGIAMFSSQAFGLPVIAQSVVISEVMVSPVVVSSSNGQWIELHNTTNEEQDITGYSVSAEGSIHQLELANLLTSFVIEPQGYFLMCANSNSSENGGITSCDYSWNDINLSENGSEITLNNSENMPVDEVVYGAEDVNASDSIVVERDENNQPVLSSDSETYYNESDSGTPGYENIDYKAPNVKIVSPAQGAVTGGIFDIVANISDTNLQDYKVTIENSAATIVYDTPWITAEADFLNNKIIDSVQSSTFPDGNYTLKVTARDSGSLTETDEVAIKIDNTAPKVTVNKTRTNNSTPIISGTISEANTNVVVIVNGQQYKAKTSYGSWRVQLQKLKDGIYNVRVIATDMAGNIGRDQSTNELKIDSTAPKITVNRVKSFSHSPTLTGTIDDPTARIVISVANNSFVATNHGDGTWSLKDTRLTKDGVHGTFDVKATATDDFGNVGRDNTVNELTITGIIESLLNGFGTIVYAASDTESGNANRLDSDGDGIPDSQDKTPFGENEKEGADETKDQVSADDNQFDFEWAWVIIAIAAVAFLWFLLKSREEQ